MTTRTVKPAAASSDQVPGPVPVGRLLPAVFDLPAGRVVIVLPAGVIVTDQGRVFTAELVSAELLPVRVRCQQCPWQAIATGLDDATSQAARHAAAHDHHERRAGR